MAASNGRHGAGESDEERDSDEDEEEYNSDVYFERLDAERNQKKYMEGIKLFLSQEASGGIDSLLRDVEAKSFEVRGKMVMQQYEPILWKFHDRPRGKFITLEGFDELEVFCRAFRLGWKLWPDSWTGMLMMLDYIAEKFSPEDIARLDSETIDTVKQVASTKTWPNNPFAGSMLSTAAKTILARHSRSASFEEATTIEVVRRMAVFHRKSDGEDGLDSSLTKLIESMSLSPAQPARRKQSYHIDQRRICDAPLCTNVEEGTTKFPRCSRCKQVAYCCKECQRHHWKNHKKQCSPAT